MCVVLMVVDGRRYVALRRVFSSPPESRFDQSDTLGPEWYGAQGSSADRIHSIEAAS